MKLGERPRVLLVVLAVVALAALVALWRWRGDAAATPTAATAATPAAPSAHAAAIAPRPDPRKLERASITGAITDEAKAPIAGARVCADASSPALPGDLTRDPRCTITDAAGRYALENVLAARYAVVAMAKGFQPDTYFVDAARRVNAFDVAAGEHRSGIDIALRAGGVELTGTVADVTGGTIPRAQVRAANATWAGDGMLGPMVETDAAGHYALWVRRGNVDVVAVADGYAPGRKSGQAPGKLDVLLSPESTLSGTVVDATGGQPVPGAHVVIDGWDTSADDLTDERGRFHLTRLGPGRYVTVARTAQGYGKSEGSTLVGLGQHVDGVTIALWPAQRLVAHVVIGAEKKPCPYPDAYLEDMKTQRWVGFQREADGTLVAEGVLPGTYKAHPACDGYRALEDSYAKIVVGAGPVPPLEWRVEPGATITGRVLTRGGAPIEGAEIVCRNVGAAREAMQWTGDRSAKDGTYKLVGLRPGAVKLEVTSDSAVGPKEGFPVDVAGTATVTRDLVLDDAGAIHGTVVDATGAPVADVVIDARSNRQGEWSSSNIRSDDTGRFHIDAVRAGEYRVVASRGWTDTLKKPGTTDDATQGEKVTVHATQIATVQLLVEAQTGAITGVVTDAKGAPIADAFVAAARESDAAGAQPSSVQSMRWWGEDRPIVTGTDGTFTLAKLASPGKYTVRAYRKGGGEAIAEHVATGGRASLRLAPTGSLAGTVARDGGGSPDEITVSVRDLASAFSRDETYYRTSGRFAVRDLPPGHFVVDAKAVDGHLSKELDLAEGEARTGVDFTLVALLTVTGRVVEAGTQTPVAGIMMFAQLARSADMSFTMDSDQQNISGADGRFTLVDVPRGQLQIRGFPREWKDSPYAYAVLIKQLDGSGTIDLGDVPVMKKRVAPGEPIGELGVHFAEQAPGTPPEQLRAVVSYIDPAGPAARSGLVVGDVVIAVDGTDITGTNSGLAWNQLNAPPGTTIRLGLARGATVAIVLAAP